MQRSVALASGDSCGSSSRRMNRWKAILLVYDKLDLRYPTGRWRRRHFVNHLSAPEIAEAEESFGHFPLLVSELTEGRAFVDYTIRHIKRPLERVSAISHGGFWPAPEDVRTELETFIPPGSVDSIFVLWPQNDFVRHRAIPSHGWGYGMGGSAATNGATYATVANALTQTWQIPRVGEVWLHEWLHGVCHHFARRGYVMPDGDADGGERHGYVRSATTGWTDYYRDLMNGRVQEDGVLTGIASRAWSQPRPGNTMPA
jgi:hypothetical protein